MHTTRSEFSIALRNPLALQYAPHAQGLESARRAAAKYYAERGIAVAIEDIFLTTSTSEAYSFAFRTLCNDGDEILVPQPSYPLFDFLAEIQDVSWCVIRWSTWKKQTPRHGGLIFRPWKARLLRARAASSLLIPTIPLEIFLTRKNATDSTSFALPSTRRSGRRSVFGFRAGIRGATAQFGGKHRRADFYDERNFENLRLATDESGLACGKRPGKIKSRARARLEVIADTYLSVNAPIQLALPVFLEQWRAFQTQLLAVSETSAKSLTASSRCKNRAAASLSKAAGTRFSLPLATQSDEDTAIQLIERSEVYVHQG